MTLTGLAIRGLAHHWRTQVSVLAGVACAVAVFGGALQVGSSVRSSLAALVTERLGRTEVVLSAETPFTDALAVRLGGAPMFVLEGSAVHAPSSRRANGVRVYGIDWRFFDFHRVAAEAPTDADVLLSPDLAGELDARPGDAMVIRVARPSDIPLDSLQGRKDDVSRSLRLTYKAPLRRESMGEFSLGSDQSPVRAVFVSLSRLQRDLYRGAGLEPNQPPRANALLLAGKPGAPLDVAAVRTALARSVEAADLGLRVEYLGSSATIVIESASGLLTDALADAIVSRASADRLPAERVFTWLATRITDGTRSVPYSLVTGLREEVLPGAAPENRRDSGQQIVLNDWAARDLGARVGDAIDLEYYRWADEGRLVTDHAAFRLAGIVPIEGLAADRRLAPDYPGITNASGLGEWDPPFPINLKLVRPADDDYWRRYKTTPKAFVSLAVAQQLWRTRHGQLTSIRLGPLAPGTDAEATINRLKSAIAQATDPLRSGFAVIDVRRENLAASVGATDFGAYFSYFSFFLMVSALLLAALLFRLSVEQRLPELGVLRAMGFAVRDVRRVFLIEGAIVATVGAVVGMGLAVGWAALMMWGLRTWWVGAVGTTSLRLHVALTPLLVGGVAGAVAAVVSTMVAFRSVGRSTPRGLLSGSIGSRRSGARTRAAGLVAVTLVSAALVLSVLSLTRLVPAAGGFFGAGALVLAGGVAALRRWLDRARPTLTSVVRLGIDNASWRPGRSLTASGLVAAAVFLLVSVDAFRKRPDSVMGTHSATGGFALFAESELPIVHDPSTPAGRLAIGLDAGTGDSLMAGVSVIPARLRPGDEASCLNLYQPARPRVLGVGTAFLEARRFRFAKSLASAPSDRENPWRLLSAPVVDDVVPAIADATSLEYVLHASVGDVIVIDAGTSRPKRLRIVAALDDSMLQGELIVAEPAFFRLFPESAGYRVFFIDVAASDAARAAAEVDQVAQTIEERLDDFGVDVEESSRRLASYHRVENTYLSTFQALGGLGLVLGTFGIAAIVARNVLERRRELALLRAAGFTARDLQVLVIAEQLTLVIAGVGIGLGAALVAIGPVLIDRHAGVPALPVASVALVLAAGVLSALGTTRGVRRLALMPSLRSE